LKKIVLYIPDSLFWKIEEERVKKRIHSIEEYIIRVLLEHHNIIDDHSVTIKENKTDKVIDEVLAKYIDQNKKGIKYAREIVELMLQGCSFSDAIKIISNKHNIHPNTVYSVISRSSKLKVTVRELIEKIINDVISEFQNYNKL